MNRNQQIIATGGGAPTLEKNRKYLSKGFVIYLYVKPQSLWTRLQHDDSRPLLQASTDVRKKLEESFLKSVILYIEILLILCLWREFNLARPDIKNC